MQETLLNPQGWVFQLQQQQQQQQQTVAKNANVRYDIKYGVILGTTSYC